MTRKTWLAALAVWGSATAMALSTGMTVSAATSPPADHPQAQSSAALHGCPAGSALYVPDQQSIAAYGTAALVPANMPEVRRTAAADPALKPFASAGIHWLSSVHCGRSDHSNGGFGGEGGHLPGTLTRSQTVSPMDTPTQRYCNVVPAVDCSANWSGYESGPGAPAGSKTGASMDWNVPTQSGSDDNSDAISVWPGIGRGSSSDYLVQAGTESDQTSHLGGIFKSHSYTAWYEVVPGENEVPIDDISVHPGDHMSVLVFYDGSTQEGSFLVLDVTTNQAVDMQQTVPGPTGSQSEWIVERSCSGSNPNSCNYQKLGNFGTEHISNAGGNVTSGDTISPFSLAGNGAVPSSDPQQIPMTNCARTQFLAWPDYPDNTGLGFDDIWQNYGPVEAENCP